MQHADHQGEDAQTTNHKALKILRAWLQEANETDATDARVLAGTMPELAVEIFRPREARVLEVPDVSELLRDLIREEGVIQPAGLIDLSALPGSTLLAVRLLEPLAHVARLTRDVNGTTDMPRLWAAHDVCAEAAWAYGVPTTMSGAASQHAECQRCSFRLRFVNFVDALVEAYADWHDGRRPLFVIALVGNDFEDQLARLFRVLGHERLVFLRETKS